MTNVIYDKNAKNYDFEMFRPGRFGWQRSLNR